MIEIDVNGQNLNKTVLILEDKSGMIYLRSIDLESWRLQKPNLNTQIYYEGDSYFPLSSISNLIHTYNPEKQTLTLKVRAEAFELTNRTSEYIQLPKPQRSSLGGFFNYDLYTSNASGTTTGNAQESGQFEIGIFNSYGVGTSTVLTQNISGVPGVIRLDSTWTSDFPEKMQTLRVGDVFSTPGAWGRAVRFGGIQFGTNFSTQPGFITYPMQSVAGQAVLPSTVDVFINNALVSRQTIPPGPFAISNLPVVSGAGQVNLLVRDLFGREQIISKPFYASQSLLGKGLESFSYEIGVARDNFGLSSNDYHGWLFSENYRVGISNFLTAEFHTEAMQSQEAFGLGVDYLVPKIGTLSSYFAQSYGKESNAFVNPQFDASNNYVQSSNNFNGMNALLNSKSISSGNMVMLGLDRFAYPWSMSARSQWTNSSFIQIGQSVLQLPSSNLTSANLSYSDGHLGSIGIAFVSQINRGVPDTQILTLSYGASLGRMGSFSVSALKDLNSDLGTTIFTMFSIAIEGSTSASLSAQSTRGANPNSQPQKEDIFTSTVQQNLPSGEGFGYLLQSRSDQSSQALVEMQNNMGTYFAGVSKSGDITATRLEAIGGVAYIENNTYLGRRIDQSFAVASVPGFANVSVLSDNQLIGRTDSKGDALIPRLRAYDRNIISINQEDLPLDAKVMGLQINATPYFRSGIEVKFPVERSKGATFTLNLENGLPVPLGSAVNIDGVEEIFTVGYGGEVYVAGLSEITKMHATVMNRICNFQVHFPITADPLPDLGIVICKLSKD